MNGKLALSLILAVCLMLMIATAKAYNPLYTIDAPIGTTPIIDGTVGSTEWSDAYAGTYNSTTYFVKQDGNSLYIGFHVSDSTIDLNLDIFSVAIDTLNDGGGTPKSDDIIFYVFRSGTLMETTDNNSPGPPIGGWNAASTSDSSGWQAEFAIDFGKVGIVHGEAKTLGLALATIDDSYPTFWPPMLTPNSPSYWGNLTSLDNWVPEFTSLLIVLLLMIVTLLAAIASKRRLLKNQIT
jgi:hypothetical protein